MRIISFITLFVATAFAKTYTVDHGFSDVQALTDHVRDVNSKLDRFNGGLLQGLDLVNTIHKAHKHAAATRRNFETLGNLTVDDSDRGFPQVQDLIQMMAVTFETSKAKVCACRIRKSELCSHNPEGGHPQGVVFLHCAGHGVEHVPGEESASGGSEKQGAR